MLIRFSQFGLKIFLMKLFFNQLFDLRTKGRILDRGLRHDNHFA